MIAKYTNYISRWLWIAAETILAWLKQHGPAACKRGLDKLQRLQVSTILETCVPYMRGLAYMTATVLVVYFLATTSLVEMLILVTLFLGFALVLHKFSGNEPQPAT